MLSPDLLSPQVTHLRLHARFNSHLPPLPITHLSFDFDHLPLSLLQLQFGNHFFHPLDCLPLSHEKLASSRFNSKFNHSLEHLPSTITSLNIPSCFSQAINKLPHSLTYLEISNSSLLPIHSDTRLAVPVWPPALQELTLESSPKKDLRTSPSLSNPS